MVAYRGNRGSGFSLGPIGFLIALNLVMLIATYIRPELIYTLGLRPSAFADRPWTILTSMFIHGGLGHIFGNMLTLFFFGSFLSRLVGERIFLIIYFGGGLLGGLFYLWLGDYFSTAVGASGAVFAVGGALALLMPRLKVFLLLLPIPIPLWIAVFGGFVLMSFLPGVAWQGHLGGILFGLGVAAFLRFRRRGTPYS